MDDSSFIRLLLLLLVLSRVTTSESTTNKDGHWLLFPQVQCLIHAAKENFALVNFDKYDQYFRDDSVMVLAQTGQYISATNIEEYVKFSLPKYSPFFMGDTADYEYIDKYAIPRYIGYDPETGLCEFQTMSRIRYQMNPATTGSNTTFDLIIMGTAFYNINEGYFSRINLFYQLNFLDLFFNTLLNSTNTQNFICSVFQSDECSTIVNATNDCQATLADLPITEGEQFYADGNSQGCRALHSVLATINPSSHCPHISFSPVPDPKGAIKCQESSGIKPTDLFTPTEFKAYEDFARKNGIGPEIGHTCCSEKHPDPQGCGPNTECPGLFGFDPLVKMWRMHNSFSLAGCVEVCYPQALINALELLGWTCGSCWIQWGTCTKICLSAAGSILEYRWQIISPIT